MPGKHRLYMHCPALSEDQIRLHLQQFGHVRDVYLPINLDGSGKGYGFTSFDTAEGLDAALAAGDEHVIEGKIVRVARAAPRPALHTGFRTGALGQPAQYTAPLAGGISHQRGGYANPPCANSADIASGWGTDSNGNAEVPKSRPSLPQGAGPRTYVGGIPNSVSETMVRDHFSKWGKVEDVYFPSERSSGRRRPFCFVTFEFQKAAEQAVAQSNREIGGYQVASICMTADRNAHYQQVTEGAVEGQPTLAGLDHPTSPAHTMTYEAFMHRLKSGAGWTTCLPGGQNLSPSPNQACQSIVHEAAVNLPGLPAHPSHSPHDVTAVQRRALQGQPAMQASLQSHQLLPGARQPSSAACQGQASSQPWDAFQASIARPDLPHLAVPPFPFQDSHALTLDQLTKLHGLLQQQQGLSLVLQRSAAEHQELYSSLGAWEHAAMQSLGPLPSRFPQQQQPASEQTNFGLAHAMGQQQAQVPRHEQHLQLTLHDIAAYDPILRRPH